MLTLRNCVFVDPASPRTSTAMLCRESPALGPDRPWSVRALIGGRDRDRVLRVGVLVVKLTDKDRRTAVDVEWLDRVFSDQQGVAAFFRQMSGGRLRLEWQAFPATELMSSAEKAARLATLSEANRAAARAKGIPVGDFDHWMWLTDEGVSDRGTTKDNDSFMGTKDFTVSVATHELMHRCGADGHADARVADDYGDGYCIMGVYQRSFANDRLTGPPPAPVNPLAPVAPKAGPGLSAPYAFVVGWLGLRSVAAFPGDPPTGTRIDLWVNAGAPTRGDDRVVAATIGATPVAATDPAQFWLEYRQARGFDRGINDGPQAVPTSPRPGVIHASRMVIDPEDAKLNPGKARTFFVGATPAVPGARLNELAGRTPRVEVVSSQQPLVRLVLDPPVRHAYLFKGSSYVRYDRLEHRTDANYPLPIADYWNGMAAAGFADDLDAVLPWFGSRLYFFKGSSYVRYDLAADRVDPGYPRPIAGNWRDFAERGFGSGLDAAVNWGNEHAYFFRGPEYLRYDLLADTVEGPYDISRNWKGLAGVGFGADIDSCVPWYDGMAYFLKGSRYLAYDMITGKVRGAAQDIHPAWAGLAAAGFGSDLRAAFCAPPPEA